MSDDYHSIRIYIYARYPSALITRLFTHCNAFKSNERTRYFIIFNRGIKDEF